MYIHMIYCKLYYSWSYCLIQHQHMCWSVTIFTNRLMIIIRPIKVTSRRPPWITNKWLFVCRPCWQPQIKWDRKRRKELSLFWDSVCVSSVLWCFFLVLSFSFFSFWKKAMLVCDTLCTCTSNVFLKVEIRVQVKLLLFQ